MNNTLKRFKLVICFSLLLLMLCMCSVASSSVKFLSNESKIYSAENASQISPASLWENVRDTVVTENAQGTDSTIDMNGIRVDCSGSGATVKFKNALDVSKNQEDDPLLTFMILAKTQGNKDFNTLTIRFTDALDLSNYVDIRVHTSIWWAWSSFFQASIPGVSFRGTRYGIKAEGLNDNPQSGYEVFKSFNGEAGEHESIVTGGKQEPMSISYNHSEKTFYAKDHRRNWGIILDLKDPAFVGAGNEWKGFKSGLVNVSISVSDFVSSSCSYLILDINGNSMSGETILDNKAPTIDVEAQYFSEIPKAEANKPYNIFSATAVDEIEGSLTSSIVRTIINPDKSSIVLEGDAFTPLEAGVYLLEYSAIDSSLNKAVVQFEIQSVISVSPIAFNIDDSSIISVAKIGEKIFIPASSASGGAGLIETNVSVYRATDKKQCEIIDDEYFIADLSGTYTIHYSAKDYLGNGIDKLIYINVSRGTKPIVYFPSASAFPKAFISGKPVMLPEIESYDYVTNPQFPKVAKTKIEVQYDNAGDYFSIDSQLFTPDASKSTMSLKYTVYCGDEPSDLNGGNYETMTYSNIKLLNPKQFDDYFTKDNITATYAKTYVEFQATTTNSDASMEFVNPLSAKNFNIEFVIPNGTPDDGLYSGVRNNFNYLRITLTDYFDFSQKLIFDIRKTDGGNKSVVYFNDIAHSGTPYEMAGSYCYTENVANVAFKLKFDATSLTFLDYNDDTILKAKTCADGKSFSGFKSGKLYLKMEMLGLSGESSIRLTSVMNQPVFANFNSQNELQSFSDNRPPVLEYESELIADASLNQRISLPTVIAYDVIDPYVQTLLTVIAPDGTRIFDNVVADSERSFIASSYGRYVITYSAVDSSGRRGEYECLLDVTDKSAPIIFIESELPSEVKFESSFIIPSAKVFGDIPKNIKLYIFITAPDMAMTEVFSGMKFSFNKRGNYTLTYYAIDEFENYAIKTITIRVK